MTKEECEVCKKPAEVLWRVNELERNVKEYRELTEKKLDKINNLLIGTLTTGGLSVLLLLANLVFTKTV